MRLMSRENRMQNLLKEKYDEDFYKGRYDRTSPSARVIIPLILEKMDVKSVIDIGCGIGAWLSVFREYGVSDIFGVDGNWVDKKMLKIPSDCFLEHNLNKVLNINRKADLAVSLEVAEHLPKENAQGFIAGLTELAPVILFSAAIPFQGGIDHINEQWPDYWTALFLKKGYLALDCIRRRIWQNDDVVPHYAQNIFLFVRKDYLENNALLMKEYDQNSTLSLVHPKIYLSKIDELQLMRMSLREVLKVTPILFLNALKRRVKQLRVMI
jgi:SAM-dependent methyltransferase